MQRESSTDMVEMTVGADDHIVLHPVLIQRQSIIVRHGVRLNELAEGGERRS